MKHPRSDSTGKFCQEIGTHFLKVLEWTIKRINFQLETVGVQVGVRKGVQAAKYGLGKK